jgi:lysine biosynthesis protein LysW
MSQIAYCPECDSRIRFHSKAQLGQRVICQECGETLEIVRLRPLELDWAYDDSEEDGFREPSESRFDYADFDDNDF